ncbi:MAG: hypothetical protein EBV07_01655 [Proteobacteria bacterium]|nr:hypothetical protein [Pseudomonadota bacterium]
MNKILAKIRTDRYVVTAICPAEGGCNSLNNINASVSNPYKIESKINCAANQPIFSSWVIVRDVEWKKNLPSSSRQAATFGSQSSWNLQLAPENSRVVDCVLRPAAGTARLS